MALVEHYTDSQVAVITLSHIQSGNVLNMESLSALQQALQAAVSDEQIRVIVLRSQGNPFCLGMDLQALQTLEQDESTAKKTVDLYVEVLTSIYTAPQPVIAVVQGAVKAGGVGLAGACDVIVATEQSTFEMTEVILGLIPANVMPFIYSLRLPPQKLRYLVLTAKQLNAEEAKQLNLVDEVVPAESMERMIKGMIKKFFRASPQALAETKRFTNVLFGEKMETGSRLAKEKLLNMIQNPEVMKAIRAFNEGEVPSWFGKFKPEKPVVL
ncbi:enoyl-CoA hydratase/isomerase family protein [bacterium]|nr:enoyl-CoA hydratase/isomerase family protein [bacterium]